MSLLVGHRVEQDATVPKEPLAVTSDDAGIPAGNSGTTDTALARRVGPGLLLLLVVGDILGAGIYVLIGPLSVEVGGMTWLAFGGAFVIAAASATSYAELVGRFPGAAGSALYVKRAFDFRPLTMFVSLAIFISSVLTAATTARAFAGDYLTSFVTLPVAAVAAGFVVVVALVAARGIVVSAGVNAVMTLAELSGLVLVVTIAAVTVGAGDADLSRVTDTSSLSSTSLLSGVALAFFAFLGFEDAVHLSEEVKDPQRTFPRVLFAAVLITGVTYLLVAVGSAVVVPADVLGASDGPLLEVVRAGRINVPDRLFAAIALAAVTNTSLAATVAAARLLYGMAGVGELPKVFGSVHGRWQTPVVATAATAAVVLVLSTTSGVGELADYAVTALLTALILVNTAAIRTRHHASASFRPWRWPAGVAVVACSVLLVHQLWTGGWTWLMAMLVVIGAAFALSAAMDRADA